MTVWFFGFRMVSSWFCSKDPMDSLSPLALSQRLDLCGLLPASCSSFFGLLRIKWVLRSKGFMRSSCIVFNLLTGLPLSPCQSLVLVSIIGSSFRVLCIGLGMLSRGLQNIQTEDGSSLPNSSAVDSAIENILQKHFMVTTTLSV